MAQYDEQQQPISPYRAAEQRGDLVKLARLGRTGKKQKLVGYGNTYTWHDNQFTIYIDEPTASMMITDVNRMVCYTINELLVPGEWFDRLLNLAATV